MHLLPDQNQPALLSLTTILTSLLPSSPSTLEVCHLLFYSKLSFLVPFVLNSQVLPSLRTLIKQSGERDLSGQTRSSVGAFQVPFLSAPLFRGLQQSVTQQTHVPWRAVLLKKLILTDVGAMDGIMRAVHPDPPIRAPSSHITLLKTRAPRLPRYFFGRT